MCFYEKPILLNVTPTPNKLLIIGDRSVKSMEVVSFENASEYIEKSYGDRFYIIMKSDVAAFASRDSNSPIKDL